MKRRIDPKETPTKDLHQYILGSIAPRPIAFVSSINEDGVQNLAPYSFFNAFSSNPPIAVFSSNRKVADNTTKDTLHNAEVQKELVINMVSYDIVRQMAISSVSYPTEVSEFEKTGLTPLPSELVNAPRVAESPVNMECRVKEIITLGDQGGAGHLIICEILMIHIDEEVLDGNRIDPHKIDLMGRMGRTYYVRASGEAISSIYQSVANIPIGYDGLPENIRKSDVLSANDIAAMAGLKEFPEPTPTVEGMDQYTAHQRAKELISIGDTEEALALLLSIG